MGKGGAPVLTGPPAESALSTGCARHTPYPCGTCGLDLFDDTAYGRNAYWLVALGG